MPEVVICLPLRSPVGRFGGALNTVPVEKLAATVLGALVERSGIDPGHIDDVILGQGYPNGEAPALGRVAALDAGLGIDVPGMQLDRRCGSGSRPFSLPQRTSPQARRTSSSQVARTR